MMKIDSTDYAAVAREIGLVKQVTVEEAVIVDGVETKPAVVEEELLAEPDASIVGIPVDANGNHIGWTNLAARAGIMWQFDMTDVEQDPKSTPDKPLPPLNTDRYEKLIIVGKDKAALAAMYEAKLTAAKATVEARRRSSPNPSMAGRSRPSRPRPAHRPAPVEGEIEGKVIPK